MASGDRRRHSSGKAVSLSTVFCGKHPGRLRIHLRLLSSSSSRTLGRREHPPSRWFSVTKPMNFFTEPIALDERVYSRRREIAVCAWLGRGALAEVLDTITVAISALVYQNRPSVMPSLTATTGCNSWFRPLCEGEKGHC